VLDRIPIRWRLALTSAGLTFVILACFAIAIGQLTASRIRSDFNNEMAAAAGDLADRMTVRLNEGEPQIFPNLDLYAAPNHAVIRVLSAPHKVIASTKHAPNLNAAYDFRTARLGGYRIVSRDALLRYHGVALGVRVQYARKVSDLESTVKRVRLFLLIGVLGGTGLALAAGLILARRAMLPITALTSTARKIADTRDPGRQVPLSGADDEVAELGPVADGHNRAVDADEAVVDGTRDELHRMTLNLMENALRHTPAGTRVRARVVANDDEVVLTVQDNGPGVPPELRERIFERFVRGDGDRGSSSGLGLSIVRAVAESHGGKVTVEDATPGARFVVRLPRAAVTAPEPAPAPTPA
jgi:hypothetical protein